MTNRKNAVKELAPYLFLGVCLLVLLFLNTFYLENWLDSDMAAEMIFSKLLAEQGRWIAPEGWFYSTEFRILYTQLFMAPLFRLSSNWHLIRLLTNLLTYGLLLLSYFYLMRRTQVRKEITVWCASLLLLPFSETMMLHMQMGNTYMFHVILIFFGAGLFLRLTEDLEKGQYGPGFCVRFLLFGGLSLILGMSGVRYFLSFYAPLLLTCFLVWRKGKNAAAIRSLQKGEESAFRNGLMASLKENAMGKTVLLALLATVAALVGYVINGKVIRSMYFFQTYDTTNFVDIYQGTFTDRLQDTFGSLVMLFGYIPGKSVLSLRGIVSICSMVLGILVIRVYFMTRKLLVQGTKNEGFLTFAGTAFTVSAFALLFTTSTNVPRYFIPSVIFLAPVFALYFDRQKELYAHWVTLMLLILCMGLCTVKTEASMMTADKNADRIPAIRWLTDNGYTFGYATYWNANITQELSNGALEVANILEPESVGFFKWSSREDYYLDPEEAGSKVPAGKVFMLLTIEQADTYRQAPSVKGGTLVYNDDHFVVYSYDRAEDLLQYQVQ